MIVAADLEMWCIPSVCFYCSPNFEIIFCKYQQYISTDAWIEARNLHCTFQEHHSRYRSIARYGNLFRNSINILFGIKFKLIDILMCLTRIFKSKLLIVNLKLCPQKRCQRKKIYWQLLRWSPNSYTYIWILFTTVNISYRPWQHCSWKSWINRSATTPLHWNQFRLHVDRLLFFQTWKFISKL